MIIDNNEIIKKVTNSIPVKLLNIIKNSNSKCYFAGGLLTSIFTGSKINDFDIFSETVEDFTTLYNSLYSRFPVKLNTDNAVTLECEDKIIQLIKPTCMCGKVEEVINRFDFTISMAAYYPLENKIFCNDRFFIDLSARKLVYNINSIRPISTLYRIKKYIDKGYSINGIELIKLGLTISKIKITSFKQYKNEINGIDANLLNSHFNKFKNKAFNLDNIIEDLINNEEGE